MLSEKMGIDDIDCMIMDLIQRKPALTHAQIAELVNRSQPTVGMRLNRLQKLGVLKFQAGITLKNDNLCFARVDIQTNNPSNAFEIVKNCPFMLNGFKLSGEHNLSIIITGVSYKDIDKVINYHFRNNLDITNVTMEIIVDVADDLVLPLNLNSEHQKICPVCNEDIKY
ncbi:MAG: Lrp/AsnC family transcriptional regulator [Candidatus Lokiarchaeota archaeon]|nr:Lrp/AsnC family transcriptional regulator [Candidatus Lokiarchaeota archaeon]